MSVEVMIQSLGQAFLLTLAIFSLTLVFSLPLGLLVALGRMSKIAPLRWLVKAYIAVIRGTPLVLQLMMIYFGPNLIFGITLPGNWRFNATIVAFALNYAAYFAEIYRGGIESMPLGQYEAAEVLGYSKRRTFLTIILPQVVKNILPAVTNEVIILVKDTSLAYALGVVEMFTMAKQIAVAPKSPGMLTFVVAAAIYFVFSLLVALVMEHMEKRLNYYR